MTEGAIDSPRADPATALPFEVAFLNEARLPALVRPVGPGPQGAEAVADLLARDDVHRLLQQHGAVLFRGFDLPGEAAFTEIVARHYGAQVSAYIGGVSPRKTVHEGQIYESTKVPAHLRIHQHNEMAYLRRAPRDLLLFCERPSPIGGETPLTDCRRLLAEVPKEVRDTFVARGLYYQQHFYGRGFPFWTVGIHLLFVRLHRSWRKTFNTTRREEVERHGKALGVAMRWLWDGSLKVTCRRPPTARHPDSGEEVWFNQACTLNVTPYGYGWPKSLGYLLLYPFPGYQPFHVSFADRRRIPWRYLRQIQEATDKLTVTFPWQKGDLLWLDNFLVAHGRMPYQGPRRLLVAIGPMAVSA